MKYELVIFDLDGTILDTLDDLHDSMNVVLSMYDLPLQTREHTRLSVGNGIRKLVERSIPSSHIQQLDEIEKTYREYYGLHCKDKTKPYAGILSLVDTLRQDGIKCAVVSNKGDYAVQILVKDFFGDIFDFVLGERSDIHKKPAPDMVNACLQALQVERKDAIYIGDSETDVQTAKNSNIPCIGCTYGFRDKEILEKEGATYIVDTIEEILDIIK